jgi:hypothetical protein
MNLTMPSGLGAVISVVVLVLVVVLAVIQGPSLTLGLIGAVALARLC